LPQRLSFPFARAHHAKDNSRSGGRDRSDSGLDVQRAERCANEIEAGWLLDDPRHGYLIQANGLMRMCPTVGPNHATTTNRWDVRNGMFYQDGEPYKIVKLTQSEFDYETVRESGVRVDGKFVVTCPVGTVFPFLPHDPSDGRTMTGDLLPAAAAYRDRF
jgi:hypothetical protein